MAVREASEQYFERVVCTGVVSGALVSLPATHWNRSGEGMPMFVDDDLNECCVVLCVNVGVVAGENDCLATTTAATEKCPPPSLCRHAVFVFVIVTQRRRRRLGGGAVDRAVAAVGVHLPRIHTSEKPTPRTRCDV